MYVYIHTHTHIYIYTYIYIYIYIYKPKYKIICKVGLGVPVNSHKKYLSSEFFIYQLMHKRVALKY
jgi:hypothetical protein